MVAVVQAETATLSQVTRKMSNQSLSPEKVGGRKAAQIIHDQTKISAGGPAQLQYINHSACTTPYTRIYWDCTRPLRDLLPSHGCLDSGVMSLSAGPARKPALLSPTHPHFI